MPRKLLAGLILVVVAQPIFAQSGTQKGAVLGGVGGAVLGGIIGHQNDEVPEGALIGGAVGAVAGGLLGNARDKQLERERYYQQQQWNQYHSHNNQYRNYNTYRTVPSRPTVVPAQGVTIADVLSMTRNGVGESVIVSHIYSTGMQRRIDTNEIIMLHQQGVTENIINAMQQAPLRNAYGSNSYSASTGSTTIVAPQGGTVIVQEPNYSQPFYSQPVYSQPSYVQPSYRPSYYQSYTPRRGF